MNRKPGTGKNAVTSARLKCSKRTFPRGSTCAALYNVMHQACSPGKQSSSLHLSRHQGVSVTITHSPGSLSSLAPVPTCTLVLPEDTALHGDRPNQNQRHQTPAPHSPPSLLRSPTASTHSSPLPSHLLPPHPLMLHQPHVFSFASSRPICSGPRAFAAAVPPTWRSPPPCGCFPFNGQVSMPSSRRYVPTTITSITSPCVQPCTCPCLKVSGTLP